jgi:hypothetical protein
VRGAFGNPFAASVAKRESVSDQEIAEIWTAASKASVPYGWIIRLLILTGRRRRRIKNGVVNVMR